MKEIKNSQLQKALKAVDPELSKIILIKDDGYFYLDSDDEVWADRISGLYSSSILVNSFQQMSIRDWVYEIVEVLIGDVYGNYSPMETWQEDLKMKAIEAGY